MKNSRMRGLGGGRLLDFWRARSTGAVYVCLKLNITHVFYIHKYIPINLDSQRYI